MLDSDKEAFKNIIIGLAEDKGMQLSAPGIALKFEALKQFPIEGIRRAALAMMANKKFSTMPAVSDFIEYLQGGSVDDIAQVQASIVWQAIKKYGYRQSVCFDDPITQAVIVRGFGSWQKLCAETKEDEQKWFFKDFAKMYGAFGRQGLKHFGALPGAFDTVGKGPILIGNQEKAKQVLLTENRQQSIEFNPQG